MLPQICLFEVVEISNSSPDRGVEADPTGNDNPGADVNPISEVDDICPFPSPNNSRPISLYDGTIDPFDLGILQREYDRDPLDVSALSAAIPSRYFVRFIASQYGRSINNPHLRLATVLFLTSVNSDRPWDNEIHSILIRRDRLIQSLKCRLNQPDNLDMSDIFATYLYTFQLLWCGLHDEGKVAMRGCCAIIRHLSQRSVSNHPGLVFDIFMPMVFDHLAGWACWGFFPKDAIVDLCRTLPHTMRIEECIQRYFCILIQSWSLVTRIAWLWRSRLTRFLDLAERLNLKRNGYREHLQVYYSYLSGLYCFEPFPEHLRQRLPFVPFLKDGLLSFVLDTLSHLLLGALWDSQNGTDALYREGRQRGFLTFLLGVWILEKCVDRLDGGLITRAGFEMDPDLAELIEETLNSKGIPPILLGYFDYY